MGSSLRPPAERGFDALGRVVQAQHGEDYYRDVTKTHRALQVAKRRLIRAQRQAAAATRERVIQENALAALYRELEGAEAW